MSEQSPSPLVYHHEQSLSTLTLVLGCLGWFLIVVCTFGTVILFCLLGFLIYLLTHSLLISQIKGNGVEITSEQLPELHTQFRQCCQKLNISRPPRIFLLQGNGAVNAFATRFLGHEYVILLSSTVDAMRQHEEGLSFYIGHELGHLKRKHLTKTLIRWPALWLPLIGAAYSRAKESTCDLHGRACCSTPENAARALTVLAAGAEKWKTLNLRQYVFQCRETGGFWMALHELTLGYPWLTKRVARVLNQENMIPSRHPLAYILSLYIPYSGRQGIVFAIGIYFYIAMIVAITLIAPHQQTHL